MKIKLYKVYPGIIKEELKHIDIYIKGKLATFFEIPAPGTLPESPPETREFFCKYENTYKKEFDNLKLNYKFNFYSIHEDDDFFIKEGYAYLNFLEKIKIEWIFQRSWFQKEGNIKWLISIPTSIITTIITTYIINKL